MYSVLYIHTYGVRRTSYGVHEEPYFVGGFAVEWEYVRIPSILDSGSKYFEPASFYQHLSRNSG